MNGVKPENTSLSAGGAEESAYRYGKALIVSIYKTDEAVKVLGNSVI